MPFLLLVILALTTSPVTNADLYKVVDKEGNVSFTDSPPPSNQSKTIETIEQADTNRMPSKTYKGELQDQFNKRVEERQELRKQAWEAYDTKVKDAETALKIAKEALEKGKEIQDGDRVGIVSQGKQTGSRLSEQYLQRVEELEQEVEKARKNLRKVRKQRPTLMRP